jgi:bacterioferritin-associated ferredoxin
MYVCICNRYRDAEIYQVARSGVRCARVAYSSLGNGPRCGRCLDVAQSLINEIHEDAEQHRGCSACTPGEGNPDAEYRAAAPSQHYGSSRRLSPLARATVTSPKNGDAAASLALDD